MFVDKRLGMMKLALIGETTLMLNLFPDVNFL